MDISPDAAKYQQTCIGCTHWVNTRMDTRGKCTKYVTLAKNLPKRIEGQVRVYDRWQPRRLVVCMANDGKVQQSC